MPDNLRPAVDVYQSLHGVPEEPFQWSPQPNTSSSDSPDTFRAVHAALANEEDTHTFTDSQGRSFTSLMVQPASFSSNMLSLDTQIKWTEDFRDKLRSRNVKLPPLYIPSFTPWLGNERDAIHYFNDLYGRDLRAVCSQLLGGAKLARTLTLSEYLSHEQELDVAVVRYHDESQERYKDPDVIYGTMMFRKDKDLSDTFLGALDRFYGIGGTAFVYSDYLEGGKLKVGLRRPSQGGVFDDPKEILAPAILEVVHSAVLAEVTGTYYQLRTNGNRHIAAGWDDKLRAFVFSKSFGRRPGFNNPLDGDGCFPLTLAGEFLKLAWINSSAEEKQEEQQSQTIHGTGQQA